VRDRGAAVWYRQGIAASADGRAVAHCHSLVPIARPFSTARFSVESGEYRSNAAMKPALPLGSPRWADRLFVAGLVTFGGVYILLIALLLLADLCFTRTAHFTETLGRPELQYAIRLTLVTCTISAILSLWVAVPLGYFMSRFHFPGKNLLDAFLDVPIVLPPLVIGLSLLILFHIKEIPGLNLGTNLETWLRERFQFQVTFAVPAIILSQFAVACAFAVRTMRVTFDQINPRAEMVALTLGASRGRAFFEIVLPQAWRGMVTAFTLAWARSLGEFGPIMVFAGATRMKTEVLSTSVFLELSVGRLEPAVAISLCMVAVAMVILVIVRLLGARPGL
jgi:molybdate transport system permease protein